MKVTVDISERHMAMVDELCSVVEADGKEQFIASIVESAIKDYYDTIKFIIDEAINGTSSIENPRGFLKPQEGSR